MQLNFNFRWKVHKYNIELLYLISMQSITFLKILSFYAVYRRKISPFWRELGSVTIHVPSFAWQQRRKHRIHVLIVCISFTIGVYSWSFLFSRHSTKTQTFFTRSRRHYFHSNPRKSILPLAGSASCDRPLSHWSPQRLPVSVSLWYCQTVCLSVCLSVT